MDLYEEEYDPERPVVCFDEPSEARRIARRLEFHHTPKHGSWLNPVLSRCCEDHANIMWSWH